MSDREYTAPLGRSTHTGDRADPGLVVRMVDDAGNPKLLGPIEPMIGYPVNDWHGTATLYLKESMPLGERMRRLDLARTLHDPDRSMEACCVAKRVMLAAP